MKSCTLTNQNRRNQCLIAPGEITLIRPCKIWGADKSQYWQQNYGISPSAAFSFMSMKPHIARTHQSSVSRLMILLVMTHPHSSSVSTAITQSSHLVTRSSFRSAVTTTDKPFSFFHSPRRNRAGAFLFSNLLFVLQYFRFLDKLRMTLKNELWFGFYSKIYNQKSLSRYRETAAIPAESSAISCVIFD